MHLSASKSEQALRRGGGSKKLYWDSGLSGFRFQLRFGTNATKVVESRLARSSSGTARP